MAKILLGENKLSIQKKRKKVNKFNSLFLVTIFVFSSLFALTACSLSNIYVGLVYSQAGSSYMIDEVASGILSDIAVNMVLQMLMMAQTTGAVLILPHTLAMQAIIYPAEIVRSQMIFQVSIIILSNRLTDITFSFVRHAF